MRKQRVVAVVGVGLVLGALVWAVLLLQQPRLTYDTTMGEPVTVRCLALVDDDLEPTQVRPGPPIEVEEGGVFVVRRGASAEDGAGTALGTAEDAERDESGELPDTVLVLTTEQAVADCAARRGEQLAHTWMPLLLGGVGVLVLRGRRRIAGALQLPEIDDDPRSRTRV